MQFFAHDKPSKQHQLSYTRYINLYRSIERVHALYITPYTYKHQACSSIGLALYSSNHTTRICWRFAVDLLADRLYSKSPANLQQIRCVASKSTAFCHQRICLQHLDVSICCRQICCVASKSVRYGSERTNLQQVYSMLATCCRLAVDKSVASPASLQQISSKSV